MKRKNLAFVALAVALVGCGGSRGGGPTGPTEPTGPKNILFVDVAVGSQNVSGGLRTASLILDGREIFHADWSNDPGGFCHSECQMPATVNDVALGPHTVQVKVLSQTFQSISYLTLGRVVFGDSSGASRQIDLPVRTVTLHAGDTLTYPITL